MVQRRRDFLLSAAFARRPPNILFLFPDQLRHDFVEPSSLAVRTPNLRRLAARGVRFTRAVTPAPLCAPARACLAAGLEYDRAGVPTNAQNYPAGQTTFYQRLRDAGYHVLGCGKFDLHKPELDWGLDGKRKIRDWGFTDGIDNEGKHDGTRAYTRNGRPMGPFLAFLQSRGLAEAHVADYEKRKGHGETFPTPLPDDAYGDNWIAANARSLLQAAPQNQPWFLQVNFNGPHDPWDITASMEKRWRTARFPQPVRNTQLSPETHVAVRQNYAAMIENIDTRIGEILDLVRRRGELDNTLVAFSSDHGEMLGDHNLWSKRQPYHGSTGVPLLLAGPGVRRGLTVNAPAATLDLTATFLDFAGLSAPQQMDSRSLRPVLSGQAARVRPHVLSGMDGWRLVIEDQWKYIRTANQPPQLFNLDNDPGEGNNLAPSNPELAARLDRLLPTP